MVPVAFDDVEAAVCAALDAHSPAFDPACPGPDNPGPDGVPVDPA